MRKICLLIGLLFPVVLLHAQTQEDGFISYKNEIRINLLNSVLGVPEIDYEHFVEDNFGVGVLAAFSIDNDIPLRGGLLPYARLYFGKSPASGIFIEGNTGILFVRNENKLPYTTFPAFGIGVGVGYKFLTRNNWTGELLMGIGRAFGDKDILEAYPRWGISIGKRF